MGGNWTREARQDPRQERQGDLEGPLGHALLGLQDLAPAAGSAWASFSRALSAPQSHFYCRPRLGPFREAFPHPSWWVVGPSLLIYLTLSVS